MDSFTNIEEYRKAFAEGRYVEMAESFCHEGWSFEPECAEAPGATVGVCSHREPLDLTTLLAKPEHLLKIVELLATVAKDRESVEATGAAMPRCVTEAARRVGEHILAELERGCEGC